MNITFFFVLSILTINPTVTTETVVKASSIAVKLMTRAFLVVFVSVWTIELVGLVVTVHNSIALFIARYADSIVTLEIVVSAASGAVTRLMLAMLMVRNASTIVMIVMIQ